jgi:hypothetical protein
MLDVKQCSRAQCIHGGGWFRVPPKLREAEGLAHTPYPDPLHELQVTLPLLTHDPHGSQRDVSVAVIGCVHRPP